MIRSTIDVFSVFGNTEACDTMRRMSLPDIGFGMIPTDAAEDDGSGLLGHCPFSLLVGRRYVPANM